MITSTLTSSQLPFNSPDNEFPSIDSIINSVKPPSSPHGEFSDWSRQKKADFLDDLKNNRAEDWVICIGNEGGG